MDLPTHSPPPENLSKAHIWLPVSPARNTLLVPLPDLWPPVSLTSVHKVLRVPLIVFPVSGPSPLSFCLPGISCPALVDVANAYAHFRLTQLWLRCDVLHRDPLPLVLTSGVHVFRDCEPHSFTSSPSCSNRGSTRPSAPTGWPTAALQGMRKETKASDQWMCSWWPRKQKLLEHSWDHLDLEEVWCQGEAGGIVLTKGGLSWGWHLGLQPCLTAWLQTQTGAFLQRFWSVFSTSLPPLCPWIPVDSHI